MKAANMGAAEATATVQAEQDGADKHGAWRKAPAAAREPPTSPVVCYAPSPPKRPDPGIAPNDHRSPEAHPA